MYQSGCDAGRHLGRVVRAPQPDRVDLHQAAERGADAEDDEDQAGRLRRRTSGRAGCRPRCARCGPAPGNWVCFCLTRISRCSRDQRQQDRRDEQHVDDVEAADDLLADEVAVEDREVRPGADDRDRQEDRADDAEPGAREQVVGQRVAGDAHEQGEHQHDDADQPVRLPRPAEGAGEEDAQQVHDDRGDEQQRRPVVQLAHEQAAADVEGQRPAPSRRPPTSPRRAAGRTSPRRRPRASRRRRRTSGTCPTAAG